MRQPKPRHFGACRICGCGYCGNPKATRRHDTHRWRRWVNGTERRGARRERPEWCDDLEAALIDADDATFEFTFTVGGTCVETAV